MSGRRWMGQALPFGTVVKARGELTMMVLRHCAAAVAIPVEDGYEVAMLAGEHLTLLLGAQPNELSFLASFESEKSEWEIVEDPA